MTYTEIAEPEDQQALADFVADAYRTSTPVYPLGGRTALDYGLPARREGRGLAVSRLNRVIDYPARDMTITLEAGVTMRDLAQTLAGERQQLPVDVPRAEEATLGGVVATNFNGPRRYGLGNLRDHVIGIRAVDGRGRPYQGGGRVVKNVAGYDFCKLLTGSLGTLGVITQVTLKLKPIAEQTALLACPVPDLQVASQLLDLLAETAATPAAIELLVGPTWQNDPTLRSLVAGGDQVGSFLVLLVEGTRADVGWMRTQLIDDFHDACLAELVELDELRGDQLWRRVVEFPAEPAALVVKANVVPSGTTRMIDAICAVDSQCSVEAHAGSGVVIASLTELPAAGLARTLVGQWQPLASSLYGNVAILANSSGAESTHRAVWGSAAGAPFHLMARVKQEFDPRGILNPDRFVYE